MKSITVKEIKLYNIMMPLVEALRTSFGAEAIKEGIIVEVVTDQGVSGWGEVSVSAEPGYTGETMATCYHILSQFMVGRVEGKTIDDPRQARELLRPIRYHEHAKHGVEAAIWDAYAKTNDMRLADLFASFLPEDHASKNYAVVGVSIGLQDSMDELFSIIDKRLEQGYKRIKLKIKRGQDISIGREARARYPDTMIMLDANSDYTLKDADHLAQLDDFNLLMIEQPLRHDDIYEHGQLNKRIKTPLCLDESIKNAADVRLALQIGAIDILNLKPARVGGFSECLDIYMICVEHELPLWIGGMMETGIGRAANVSFASLPAVNLPCDISATDRYFAPDLTEPPFVIQPDSTLPVPDGAGIGLEVYRDRLDEAVARWNEQGMYKLG